jgi:hypothetical protein
MMVNASIFGVRPVLSSMGLRFDFFGVGSSTRQGGMVSCVNGTEITPKDIPIEAYHSSRRALCSSLLIDGS